MDNKILKGVEKIIGIGLILIGFHGIDIGISTGACKVAFEGVLFILIGVMSVYYFMLRDLKKKIKELEKKIKELEKRQ